MQNNKLSEVKGKELVAAGHQFAKAMSMDTPLIEIAKMIAELASRLDCALVRGDELQKQLTQRDAQIAALTAESNWRKPDFCPVTNRPFFMWIESPNGEMVPTYGGPYDSYTIPAVDKDGEFTCERYDHDEGAWVDGECLSIRLIDDQEEVLTDAAANALRAEGAIAARNALVVAGDGSDIYATVTSVIEQLREGKE